MNGSVSEAREASGGGRGPAVRRGGRPPREIVLSIVPTARYQAIDLRRRLRAEHGDLLAPYRWTACCSYHTTAGFLAPQLQARLGHRRDSVDAFMGAYRELFPVEAGYSHDRMHLREELSDDERRVEPPNADSHLTFISSGLSNLERYPNLPRAPLFFLELDGLHGGVVRRRRACVLAYSDEEPVVSTTLAVPVSRHPIDSVNLADPRLGLMEELEALLRRHDVGHGRVEIALDDGERDAAITVNEYETLLMRHDLREVLSDPLKFVAQRGRSMLAHPGLIASKSRDYAKYDVVIVLQRIIEAFGLSESMLEKLLARMMALPASRWFRFKRSVGLLVSREQEPERGIVRGRYQSPILIQWRAVPGATRRLRVNVRRFR